MSKSSNMMTYIGVGYVFVGVSNIFRAYFINFNFDLIQNLIFSLSIATFLFTIPELVETLLYNNEWGKKLKEFVSMNFSNEAELDSYMRKIFTTPHFRYLEFVTRTSYGCAVSSAIFLIFIKFTPNQIIMDSITMVVFGIFIFNIGFRDLIEQKQNAIHIQFLQNQNEIERIYSIYK